MFSFNSVLTFCPRCGSNNFQKIASGGLFCKKCCFEFFFNTASAVAAIITDRHGRLLVTERLIEPAIGKIDLPGGFVNHDETAEEALERELREELNVRIKNIRYFISFPNAYLYSGLLYKTLDLAYTAEIADYSCIRPGDDVAGFSFLKPESINEKNIAFESVKNIINAFLKATMTKN